MTHEKQDPARRLVEADWWEWKQGMLVITGWWDTFLYTRVDGVVSFPGDASTAIPDLSDPATVGCLIATLMEAAYVSVLICEPEYGASEGPYYEVTIRNGRLPRGWETYEAISLGTAVAEALLAVKSDGR